MNRQERYEIDRFKSEFSHRGWASEMTKAEALHFSQWLGLDNTEFNDFLLTVPEEQDVRALHIGSSVVWVGDPQKDPTIFIFCPPLYQPADGGFVVGDTVRVAVDFSRDYASLAVVPMPKIGTLGKVVEPERKIEVGRVAVEFTTPFVQCDDEVWESEQETLVLFLLKSSLEKA